MRENTTTAPCSQLVLHTLPLVYSIISPSARGTKKACHDHAADFQTNTL
ncbi:hypothetical protein HMPREF0666_02998, partial [Prevotella sp. C561]